MRKNKLCCVKVLNPHKMSYDWKKIFKNKTDRELYEIYTEINDLGTKAKKIAETELLNRNFNFDNVGRQINEWKLNDLLEEEKEESNPTRRMYYNTKRHKQTAIFGFIFTLIILSDYFFHFMEKTDKTEEFFYKAFFLFVGITLTLIGIFGYRSKMKRKAYRDKKIAELKE